MPSSKPLSQAEERCVFGLLSGNSVLPSRHPPPRYARFMLSTKVHPALLSPGTNHPSIKCPQACSPASGVHTELATRPSRQANPACRLASRVQVFDRINAAVLIPRHGGDASSCYQTAKLFLLHSPVTLLGMTARCSRHPFLSAPHADRPTTHHNVS